MTQERVRTLVEAALRELGIESAEVHLERPRDPAHGDLATNVALSLASRLGKSSRALAQEIAQRIPTGSGGVTSVEVAGPGFLNFRISSVAVGETLDRILEENERFGRSDVGHGEPVNVEFVSANPTGLLHIGHGRQAALGDAIAALLEWTGWSAYREFYYNDAGRQIERLSESVFARYREQLGQEVAFPEDGYHGEIVVDIAKELVAADGDRWLAADPAEALERMRQHAISRLRQEQDLDLAAFGVHFDRYFLESSLYEDGRVDETVTRLRATGLVYEKDGAVWLSTTSFGDQKDRVMLKSDGSATYFLPDVAYHVTKWERGFRRAINVQGADHHGTVSRVRAGLRALGLAEGYPEYVLHQMVTVEEEGREVKFSKRAGDYVTLRELLAEVGADVTRYFFLMRKADGHLVFDLTQALDQSDRNPVYKVKYAHARMCSIFRKAGLGQGEVGPGYGDPGLLVEDRERELIRQLVEFPEVVAKAAQLRAPHPVCEYLDRTAGEVNSWYHAGNPTRDPRLAVLVEDPVLRRARLMLAQGARIVLRNGLHLLGLDAPEQMRRSLDEEERS
ncbi:MAG: arginine--tRNA ligase [Gemmatimonadetes bacterium]|nr:arginine--tRNA ligase [Gemmatimonadota bacterium]